MPLRLTKATVEQKSLVRNLMNMYLHEVSEYREMELDEEGNFPFPDLSCYWVEPDRRPYLIMVKGKCAGFVLVKDIESLTGHTIHTVPEFFLLNSYRGLGIGEEIARMVFDGHHGLWQIAVPEDNAVARTFWKRVIWRYTGGRLLEFRIQGWNGPVFEFSSPGVRFFIPPQGAE